MTNPIQVLELELLIENLTKRGISVNAMAEALNVNRGNFYSWRRSTKKQKRDDMSLKLSKAFAEELQKVVPTSNTQSETGRNSIEWKYISLLEQKNRDLEEEITQLRDETKKMLEEIKQQLDRIEATKTG